MVKEEEKKMPELKKLNKSISSGPKLNDSNAGMQQNAQGPDISSKNDREDDIVEPKFINSNEKLEGMNIVEGPGPDAKEPVVQEGIKEEAKD